MRAAGGGGRPTRAASAALWPLFLLAAAVASGFVFVLLNLPDHGRSEVGTGGPELVGNEEGRFGEIRRLNGVLEEMDDQTDEIAAEEDGQISRSSTGTKEKIWVMQDQLIMAKAYLNFAPPHSNSHFVRELKLRMKEIERAISQSSRGSRIPGSALQKMRAMGTTLSKAQRIYPDCYAMTSKLRAMTHNSEELLRAHQNEASFLEQVAIRTLPKGHHCLAMRLTSDYFSLDPKEREFHKRYSMQIDDFYHYALFSDNVLACAVVVNSTVSASKEPEKIMFHVVTDALNFPAMMMWFLMNPPRPATIQIESLDNLKWLPADFTSRFKQKGIRDPRHTSALNHLRFYLPEVFPSLSKVLLLDHDVVVHKDLSGLWEIDMKGKVNGAVVTCTCGDWSNRLEDLLNFSDPSIFKFDAKACIWAFGMNIFDLKEWRKQGLTATYDRWFQAGKRRRLWKAGSLPLGQVVFYNHTVPLDCQWHILGLGHDRSIGREEIALAAVIHYSGSLKPWLEISIPKYRDYWNKFLDYDNPYLQQCNIHQ